MTSTQHIAQALGQKAMADRLGVGLTAVNNAVTRGHFPSSWFLLVSSMCADLGIECPPALFKMKLPDGWEDGRAPLANQEAPQ